MATKQIKHPSDLIPAQNNWSNNIYYKQKNQQQLNHLIKTANTTRGEYLNSFYWPILHLSVCI